MKRILIVILMLAAIASAKDKPPISTSIYAPLDKIKGAIVAGLAQDGYRIDNDSNYQMAFSREMKGGGALVTTMLMGSAYSETPRQNLTFILSPDGETATSVTMYGEVTVRQGFGNVDRVNLLDNKKNRSWAENFLANVKQRAEFQPVAALPPAPPPAPVYIGVRCPLVPVRPQDGGVLVMGVDESGPAFEAGLRYGDVISKADGKVLSAGQELYDLVASKKPGETLVLEAIRDGKTIQFQVKVRNRTANALATNG
jgi:hypothetical protein